MRYKVKDAYGGKEIVCELLAKRWREDVKDHAGWWAREDGTTFEQFLAWAEPIENLNWEEVWTAFDEGYASDERIDWDKEDDWENQKRFIQMIVEEHLGQVV